MQLVIDASIAIKWYLPEKNNYSANKILEGYKNNAFEIITPPIFKLEVVNGLTYAVVSKRVLPDSTRANIRNFLELKFNIIDLSVKNYNILFDFSFKNKITVYDASYVLLAIQENCDFLTADKKLANKLSAGFPFIKGADELSEVFVDHGN